MTSSRVSFPLSANVPLNLNSCFALPSGHGDSRSDKSVFSYRTINCGLRIEAMYTFIVKYQFLLCSTRSHNPLLNQKT